MTFFQAIILGIVQGLTEFLPISSSAHLVIVPYLLGWQVPVSEVFVFDVLVQLGTLAAVIIFFARDLWNIIRDWIYGIFHRSPFGTFNARLGWYLILATIPAGLLGITIKNQVEAAFNSPLLTAVLLYGTAILLLVAEKIGKRSRVLQSLGWLDAIWIGVFQAISIFPGISRSGATISGGMTRNLDRPSAARFSFLMSIPVMLAAGLVGLLDLRKIPGISSFLPVMAVGFLTAGVVGYFCIRWLLSYLSRRSLYPFIIYCAVFATLVIVFSLMTQPKENGNSKQTSPVVKVGINPALTWMSPLLELCAANQTGLTLFTQEETQPSDTGSDFSFQVAGSSALPGKAVILGEDHLNFIINKSNPNSSLDSSTLVLLVEGNNLYWQDGTPVQLYVYPPENGFNEAVTNSLHLQTGFSPSSLIAFQPQDILQNIRNDPSGLGFVPSSLLDDSIRSIEISQPEAADMVVKIISVFDHELTDPEKTWLACISNGLKPQ